MKLYIRQKVFSWGDRFTVKDAAGVDRYTVEGEVFTFGKKLHVYDMHGREVAYVEQRIMSILPSYRVFVGEREIAQVSRQLTFFIARYYVAGLNWQVVGEVWEHEFSVTRGDLPVATIRKAWMTWGDSYELEIFDSADELPALATVLAIDATIENSN